MLHAPGQLLDQLDELAPADEHVAPGELDYGLEFSGRHFERNGLEHVPDRRLPPRVVEVAVIRGEKPQGAARLSRDEPVLDGQRHLPCRLEPRCRPGVLLGHPARRRPCQLSQQRGADQGVQLEPALRTDAGDEQAARLGLQEQVAGVGPARQCERQARIQTVDHRDVQQHVDKFRILGSQDLVPHVVVDQQVRTQGGRLRRLARPSSPRREARPAARLRPIPGRERPQPSPNPRASKGRGG